MSWLADLRARRVAPEVQARREAYPPVGADEPGRRAVQLALLNAEWQRATRVVQHWREQRASGALPDRFRSLEEFAERMPIVDRAAVQSLGDRLRSEGRPPDLVRMTGGSTAAPVQIPAWQSEIDAGVPDLWLARSWYGIEPSSRLFLLWGHAHLLGTGWRGWLNARRRQWSDRLLGYRRWSAYDLRPDALRRAAEELVRFRPDYVLGYSVALDLFAQANASAREALRGVGVKVVIATAEGFPHPDSAHRLADLFGCPVAMEYGAVECGLIAHTHPEGGYRVFWRSHLLEALPSEGGHRLLVTSLTPRCLPLVRYEIGDEVELPDAARVATRVGVDSFARVIGRCNDHVGLANGTTVHSEAFSHAIRPCAEVRAFQVVVGADGIAVRYVADAALAASRCAEIGDRLARIHPQLANVTLVRVDSLPQTVAGKTRMVVRE